METQINEAEQQSRTANGLGSGGSDCTAGTQKRETNRESGPSVDQLKEKLKTHEVDMVQLIEKIDAMEHTAPNQSSKQMTIITEEDGSRTLHEDNVVTDQLPISNMDDCEYLLRVLQEIQEEQPMEKIARIEPRDMVPSAKEREEEIVRSMLNRMLIDIKNFPYRSIGESSRGVEPWVICAFCDATEEHYSDSCPHVPDRITWKRIVFIKNICKYCLDYCNPPTECKQKGRPCCYCIKIKGTILAILLPRDCDTPHRTICEIPEWEADSQIKKLQKQLREMKHNHETRTKNL
ncbi:unnamed protein product [Heligmosomoides polygyrus]|uniref:CCHC-type domain-containing protein n=1 Tax=Heligmosomoides polygyrus TaxID=6339 RepID=A0A183GK75_HELPZ|nr:unnamed protein product [Heligmosomoides polygyrus]